MKKEELNRYWEKIVSTMSDGLILVDPDGNIVMVNQAFERLTGFAAEEVVGNPCTMLNCDACEVSRKNGQDNWCTLFDRGRDVRKNCVIMKKDGTYLQVIKNATLLRDDEGNQIGAIETMTDISRLNRLDQELERLSRQLDDSGGFHGIIGKSSAIQNVFDIMTKAAQSHAPVIIYGESGTGKELVARAIHQIGRRKDGPFVQLNCSALNESLLESELFGHTKGAFTGAYRHRQGRFEAADGGDFFLDEIGDVPLSIQVKLLRVLETQRFERVGDHRPISVDVRIITATHKNLEEMIARNEFRQDFYFRINVIPIHIPPLRERLADIPLLVRFFIQQLNRMTGKKIGGIEPEVMDLFMAYQWPGNVRELKSALEYAFVISEQQLISIEHLPFQIKQCPVEEDEANTPRRRKSPDEKKALIEALKQTSGNQSRAAKLLGVNRVTVWNRMKKYNIELKKVLAS